MSTVKSPAGSNLTYDSRNAEIIGVVAKDPSSSTREDIETILRMAGYMIASDDNLIKLATEMLADEHLIVFDPSSDAQLKDMIESLTDYQKEDVIDQCVDSMVKPFRVHANTNNKGHRSLVDEDSEEVLEELHRIHGFKLSEVLRTLL